MLLISVVDVTGRDAMEVRVEVKIQVVVVVDQPAMIRKKKMVKMEKEIRAMGEHLSREKMESPVSVGSDLEASVDVVMEAVNPEMGDNNMGAVFVVASPSAMVIPRMTELLENLKESELEMVTKEIAHLVEEDSDASEAKVVAVKEAEADALKEVVEAWVVLLEDPAQKVAEVAAEEDLEAVIIPIMNLKHFWN